MSVTAYVLDPAHAEALGEVLARHGAAGGGEAVLLLPDPIAGLLAPALLERVSTALLRLSEERRERAIETLVALHLDSAGRPEVEQDLIDDNARLRARLLAELPMLTAAEVRARSGARSRNPSEPASRWKREGRALAVPHNGADRYPAFQFDAAGEPLPALRPVLAALPPALAPWPRLAWFASGNGWLGGRAPMEALDDPAAVLAAARRLADPAVG